jgi:hypothetical protein
MQGLGGQASSISAHLGGAFAGVEPAFGQDRKYGPVKVVASSMEDLEKGSFRLTSSSECHKVIRLPVPHAWFCKAFRTDVDIMLELLKKAEASMEVKAAPAAGEVKQPVDLATEAVAAAKAEALKAGWIESVAFMSFDVVLCAFAALTSNPAKASAWSNLLVARAGKTELDEMSTRANIRSVMAALPFGPITGSAFTAAQGHVIEMLFGPPPAESKEATASHLGATSSAGMAAAGRTVIPASLFADGAHGQKRARTATCSKCAASHEESKNFCSDCGGALIKPQQPPLKKQATAATVTGMPQFSGLLTALGSSTELASSPFAAATGQTAALAKERNRALRRATIEANAVADLELWLNHEAALNRSKQQQTQRFAMQVIDGQPIWTSPPVVKHKLSSNEWMSAYLSYAIDCRDYCAVVAGDGEAHRLFGAMMLYQGKISGLGNSGRAWELFAELDMAWRTGISQGIGSWQDPSASIFASLQMDASLKLFIQLQSLQQKPSTGGTKECYSGLECTRPQCSFSHPVGFVPPEAAFTPPRTVKFVGPSNKKTKARPHNKPSFESKKGTVGKPSFESKKDTVGKKPSFESKDTDG